MNLFTEPNFLGIFEANFEGKGDREVYVRILLIFEGYFDKLGCFRFVHNFQLAVVVTFKDSLQLHELPFFFNFHVFIFLLLLSLFIHFFNVFILFFNVFILILISCTWVRVIHFLVCGVRVCIKQTHQLLVFIFFNGFHFQRQVFFGFPHNFQKGWSVIKFLCYFPSVK